jgi:hypothetical protein
VTLHVDKYLNRQESAKKSRRRPAESEAEFGCRAGCCAPFTSDSPAKPATYAGRGSASRVGVRSSQPEHTLARPTKRTPQLEKECSRPPELPGEPHGAADVLMAEWKPLTPALLKRVAAVRARPAGSSTTAHQVAAGSLGDRSRLEADSVGRAASLARPGASEVHATRARARLRPRETPRALPECSIAQLRTNDRTSRSYTQEVFPRRNEHLQNHGVAAYDYTATQLPVFENYDAVKLTECARNIRVCCATFSPFDRRIRVD